MSVPRPVVLQHLQALWDMYPDQRFGQLVDSVKSKLDVDPYYASDEEWLKAIKERGNDWAGTIVNTIPIEATSHR